MMKIIKNIAAIFFLSMTLVFTGVAHTDTGVAHPNEDQRRDKPRERPKEKGDKRGGGDKSDKNKPRDGKKGGDRKRN